MDKEKWLVLNSICAYEGKYTISNHGRLATIATGRIKKQVFDKDGYVRYHLYNGVSQKAVHAHRLVLLEFGNKIDGKDIVDHIDGNRSNNILSNLRWCTIDENNKWGNNSNTIIVKSKSTGRVKRFLSLSDASKYYGFNRMYFAKLIKEGIFENKHFKFKLVK